VCEVLSSSTIRIDRTDKLRIYAEYRGSHCRLDAMPARGAFMSGPRIPRGYVR